jgi:hypothetical protein
MHASGFPRKRITEAWEGRAPSDFQHAVRHTSAPVLNHAGSGVTAGYSHGYPLELKCKLSCKSADHVASIVQPKGAALLR